MAKTGNQKTSKSAGEKTAAKSKKPGKAPASSPLIDASLAAHAAAKMVANRDMLQDAGANRQETGSFKLLKDSVLKPTAKGPGGLLQKPDAQKKSHLPPGGRNQVGHNQTFGADVNRTGVPRRTGG